MNDDDDLVMEPEDEDTPTAVEIAESVAATLTPTREPEVTTSSATATTVTHHGPAVEAAPEAAPTPSEAPTPPPTPMLPKDYYVVTEQLTRKEAASSRKPGLRERKCVCMHTSSLPSHHYYSKKEISGITDRIWDADVIMVRDAVYRHDDGVILCLLDEALLAKAPPNPEFNVEDYMPSSAIALVKASPENPIVKGLIRKYFGKKPPQGMKTYEELKFWIETNCKPQDLYAPLPSGGAAPANRPPPQRNTRMSMSVRLQNTQTGRCTYIERLNLDVTIDMEIEEIIATLAESREGGLNSQQMISRFSRNYIRKARQQAVERFSDIENWSCSHTEYEDYEPGGDFAPHPSGDSCRNEISSALCNYMQTHAHRNTTLRELGRYFNLY